mmetsp:Transcript_77944/g.223802  ORF Transcript_77944/g.223802 Transcript_77944/m.223802 type:complete len:217 (-) Transcript_77944:1008-1658(-)
MDTRPPKGHAHEELVFGEGLRLAQVARPPVALDIGRIHHEGADAGHVEEAQQHLLPNQGVRVRDEAPGLDRYSHLTRVRVSGAAALEALLLRALALIVVRQRGAVDTASCEWERVRLEPVGPEREVEAEELLHVQLECLQDLRGLLRVNLCAIVGEDLVAGGQGLLEERLHIDIWAPRLHVDDEIPRLLRGHEVVRHDVLNQRLGMICVLSLGVRH